ncbi:hypothetical protein F8A87_09095 [Betaproteobacteria bacterium SCN2]|jgi:hypothetical protein|nr:hypothetical protein F8A87_09095 [Betaproteobacteria bacterium SCN2]
MADIIPKIAVYRAGQGGLNSLIPQPIRDVPKKRGSLVARLAEGIAIDFASLCAPIGIERNAGYKIY